MKHSKLILASLLSVGLATSAFAEDEGNFRKIKIRKGDSLSGLAAKYLWRSIWDLNRDTVKNPDLIYTGNMLNMPSNASLSEDRIVWQKVDFAADRVNVVYAALNDSRFRGRDGSERTLANGMYIDHFGQAEVRNGPLKLTLEDGSLLTLHDGSTLLLKGVKKEKTGLVRRMRLVSGSISAKITGKSKAAFHLETDRGELILNTGSHHVALLEGKSIRVSAFEGSLELVRKNGNVGLEAQNGMLLDSSGTIPSPVALPKSPNKTGPSGVVGTSVSFEWEPIKGIDQYELRVAADPDFNDMVFQGEIYDANSFEMGIANAGRYYWSIDAVSPDGFRSNDTEGLRLDVVLEKN